MKARTLFLEHALNEGLKVKQIVFLTGMRPLLDSEKSVCGKEWESEMARWVYENSQLPKNIPVTFVNAPQTQKDGKISRPTTRGTIIEWLQTKPTPGSCLAISNQPFVLYQDAVARSALPKHFSLETVGEKTEKWTVAVVLDSVAKTVYENERSK